MLDTSLDDAVVHSPIFSAASDLSRSLDFLWLEITNRCNLQCSHCYSGSNPYEPESYGLELADWLRLLKEARELGCGNIQFIGGEPLLYFGLAELIREAHRLKYQIIEVFTNGTRLSDTMIALFKENGVMLATSFYSDDECTHDAITGVRGSQKKTLHALQRAVTAGLRTRVGVISMPSNETTLQSTVSMLQRLGIDDIGIDRVRGIGRGENITGDQGDPKQELCGACWRGRLAVNSLGEVSPCVFSHFHNVGHVSEGLAAILRKPSLWAFREEVRCMDQNRPTVSCEPWYCSPSNCSPNNCSPLQCSPQQCGPHGM